MNLRAIHGKLLALTKEYYWKERADGYDRQFFTGGDRFLPFSGIGLTWWLTRRGFELLADLARLITGYQPHLGLDRETITEGIEKVLQRNATNRDLFVADSFFHHDTLFESRALAESEFAERLWALVSSYLQDAVAEWLFVAPTPRIVTGSINFAVHGLALIAAGDDAAWKAVSADFRSARRWNSRTGHANPRDDQMMKPIQTESWLACRAHGTQRGAREAAREIMREFMAVLIAATYAGESNIFSKSAATVIGWTTQFPVDSSRVGVGYVQTGLGEIIPPLLNELQPDSAAVDRVAEWYRRIDSATDEIKRRARIAAQYVQYALVSSELEQFVHFFIALDALFGIRGNVENTIIDGIERVFKANNNWSQKTRKLFDLRSELLHGGASKIENWSGYEAYDRHFKTDPLDDVAAVALTAFRSYPA